MEHKQVDFLVQWQSLVVAPYRTVWRELNKFPGWRVTMVAPARFREGGMQDLECAPNDPRNPQLLVLPVKRWHTQVVWFKGLAAVLKQWISGSSERKFFLCFAEPYAVTALLGWLALVWARFPAIGRSPRPAFLLFAFQNLYKRFPLPVRAIQGLMFSVCDAIFVPGSEHEAVLRRQGYRGVCIRFPMWIDADLYHSKPKPEGGKLRIGYAGSLLPEKGITQVMDALIDNPSFIRDCAIEVAGDGQLRDEVILRIRKLSDLGVEARFIGAVPVEKMPEFYRSLDLLIVPSLTAPHWKEQFGRVIIEALACGCVVIGSDSGEIPHVIADDRRVFREGDMGRMQKVLDLALQDIRTGRNKLRMEVSRIAHEKYADYNVAQEIANSLASIG